MRAIKAIIVATGFAFATSAFADAACEKHAKTRNDFLECTKTDADKMLSDSKSLYLGIREQAKGDRRAAIDKNYQIWKDKLESDCTVLGYSFNGWGGGYTPDTDFQIAECRKTIAAQEFEFYKRLTCVGDMETSPVPKCAAIKKALDERR